jgi:excisionase family DNA binding protein
MKPNIENKIVEQLGKLLKAQEENETFLSFKDACKYLCVSASTLYKLTSDGSIRFHKPNGKLIYFSKTQLNEWITGRPALKKSFNEKSTRVIR